ncbi:uncharacterized protein LOC116735412 [Xiphophorus hellerii]|uniref:uncharacterized protein LOC116735412 n=1 Tax=Xiphophorus hellerii TaxID=8084 RepID=UPI0013B3601A|nr:uncharacterized protein LOC116735412 [Xiphophorus hellerii]
MSATFGTLSAFDAKEQTWEEYCEILDQFFEANDVDDSAKQRAILISVVGPATYKLMRNLVSPDKPSSKTYSQLVTRLKEHFNPKPSEIVQRYKFDSRSRKPAESVSAYVAELRRLAQDCNFGATLERRLRDRLVCGIADDRIQRRLLSESDLTFEKAFQMAVADEAANRNVSDLQQSAACHSMVAERKEKRADWENRENRDLVLACDASPYGVGAVLSHVMEDGSLSPAELLMSRRLRSTLDLLLPDIKAKVRKKQEKQKEYHDNHSKWRSFSPGDEVYVRNYSHGPKWVPAIILGGTGPVSYTVKMGDGRVMRRHVDQIKKRHVMQRDMDWAEARDAPQFPDDVVTFGPVDSVAPSSGGKAFVESAAEAAQGHVPEGDVTDVDIEQRTDPTPPVLRRSERQRKAPPYLSDFLCK